MEHREPLRRGPSRTRTSYPSAWRTAACSCTTYVRTDAHVASVGVESGATPVHSVIPLPKTVGGGVMFGNMSGAHHHPGGVGGSGPSSARDRRRPLGAVSCGWRARARPCVGRRGRPRSSRRSGGARHARASLARAAIGRDGVQRRRGGGGDFGINSGIDSGAARRWSWAPWRRDTSTRASCPASRCSGRG